MRPYALFVAQRRNRDAAAQCHRMTVAIDAREGGPSMTGETPGCCPEVCEVTSLRCDRAMGAIDPCRTVRSNRLRGK